MKVGRACHKTNYRRTLPPQCVICAQITRIIQFCLVFVLFCLVFVFVFLGICLYFELPPSTVCVCAVQITKGHTLVASWPWFEMFAIVLFCEMLDHLYKRFLDDNFKTCTIAQLHMEIHTKPIASHDEWCVHRCHRFCCKFESNSLQCSSTIVTGVHHPLYTYIQKRSSCKSDKKPKF